MSSRHVSSGRDVGGDEELLDSSLIEEEYEKILSYPDEVDYYSLLSLPRDPPPSEAQIRAAFRTLTLSFHPDKQPLHLRDVATKHYNRIREAYDTLLDPQKRVVYDMLGEAGVKAEWGVHGVFGSHGEAERWQIGVKTMDQTQFRKWFLRMMKRRELKLVEQMAPSKGNISIHINAQDLALRMLGSSHPTHKSLVRVSSVGLGFGFKTPFTPLQWFRWTSSENDNGSESDDEDEADQGVPLPNEQDALLEISASVGGPLIVMSKQYTFTNPDTQEEQVEEETIPHVLMGEKISLGATLSHQINQPTQKGSALSKIFFPLVGESLVAVGGTVLPGPGAYTTFSKSIQPIEGTRPFTFTVQGTWWDLTFKHAPTISTSIQRRIGNRGLTYCNWMSGNLSWPSFIQEIFSSSDGAQFHSSSGGASSFQLGYVALPVIHSPQENHKTAEDWDESDTESSPIDQPVNQALETWGLRAHTTPHSAHISINYARNLFGGKLDELPRSEWNYEGYQPQKSLRTSRAVRLEVNTTIGLDLSLGWAVSGSRWVTDFTRMGLEVGVQAGHGLVCSLSWARLGQSIKIPIAICPLDHLAPDIALHAVLIPWITYSIVEFGFLRPRQRRLRKKALAKQRKLLKGQMPQRILESGQAVSLMQDQVERRQSREADRNGLVILDARYGYVPPQSGRVRELHSEGFGGLIDVTIPVAALVDQGQLNISNQVFKAHIPGFYDPAPLLPKTLKIRYRFGGAEHFVEAGDMDAVAIPMRSHMISNA